MATSPGFLRRLQSGKTVENILDDPLQLPARFTRQHGQFTYFAGLVTDVGAHRFELIRVQTGVGQRTLQRRHAIRQKSPDDRRAGSIVPHL
jgi:hypothetical protein